MTAYFLSGLMALIDTRGTLGTFPSAPPSCCFEGDPLLVEDSDEELSRFSLIRCLHKVKIANLQSVSSRQFKTKSSLHGLTLGLKIT